MSMLKLVRSLLFVSLFVAVPAAHAATIVSFEGATNGSLAMGTASISFTGNTLTASLTNTAPFDARVTGFGFNLGPGNLNGFTGSPATITTPAGVSFTFTDGDLGNVPQFSGVDLDFGYLTGSNFAGGSPNNGLDNFQTLNFVISGLSAGLTEADIGAALFVRFQRVGASGDLSDVAVVGTPNQTVIPEPASMILLGTGLVYLARRRLQKTL